MTETRITELLKGFQPQEFRRFGEFLASPYHNKSKLILELYNFIRIRTKNNDEINLDYEEIVGFLKNERGFSDTKCRVMISEFVKQMLRYLTQIGFESDLNYKRSLELAALNDRNLSKNFIKVLSEAEAAFSNTFNKDENFYYNKMYVDVEAFNYRLVRDDEWEPEQYKKISSSLDYYYVLTKLNLLHYMHYHINYLDDTAESQLWMNDDVIRYIESNIKVIKDEHPIIYMKYLILMTIINLDTPKYYLLLKDFVMKNVGKMNLNIQEYVFSALINYCLIQCNKGINRYRKERFMIYKFIEDKTSLYKTRLFSHIDFLNIIVASVEVNKLNWCEQFYEKYSNKILPEFRNDTQLITRAQILYSQKKTDDAIMLLNKVSYKSKYFYLRSKMMIAKISYETSNVDNIEYLIDAVRHYLNRNKNELSKINYELFNNFFKYISRMIKTEDYTKSEIRKIKKELFNEKYIASKEWLLSNFNKLLA